MTLMPSLIIASQDVNSQLRGKGNLLNDVIHHTLENPDVFSLLFDPFHIFPKLCCGANL